MQTQVTPEERDMLLAGIADMLEMHQPTVLEQFHAKLRDLMAQAMALHGAEDFSAVYTGLEAAEAELQLIIAHPMPEEGEEYRRQLGAIRTGAVFGYRRDWEVAP